MSQTEHDGNLASEIGAVANRVLADHDGRRDALSEKAAASRNRLWDKASEMGWFLLTIPEAWDGLGQKMDVLSALYLELGRSLAPLPLLNSMLAVDALAHAENGEHWQDLYQSIGAGEAVFAVQQPGNQLLDARRDGASIVLDGTVHNALLPAQATHLLANIRLDDAHTLAIVPLDGDNVHTTLRETWDLTRQIGDVSLGGKRIEAAAVVASVAAGSRAILSGKAHFDLAIACDSLGGAEQILTETVEYTRTRSQFGREIGSFQALKHRCADMKTWLESARALVDLAVRHNAEGDLESPLPASAKYYAAEIYRRIAMDAVQIHGGIGFTWEQDFHLFLKRALLNEQLGGAPTDYQDRLFEPLAALIRSRVA
jgi:alkylation response protein AidB-like acyl-CoA dehydrogenase